VKIALTAIALVAASMYAAAYASLHTIMEMIPW